MSPNANRRQKVVVVAIGIALLSAGGLAYGLFTATSNGNGTGTVAADSPWTLTSVTVSGVAPEVPAQKIHGTATNAAGEPEYIGTITPTVVSTSNGGCTAADFTVTDSVINAVVASGTTGIKFGTIGFNDTSANQNACQGVTVNLSFSSE